MNRRGFIIGTGAALLAAPAIVRCTSIMQVKAWSSPINKIVRTMQTTIGSAGQAVFHYPTRETFGIGDPVYIGRDGYAYRHDSDRCPAPTEAWRNPCIKRAV